MLTDIWLIAQLLVQLCSLFLLGYACLRAIEILRKWNSNYTDEIQLSLEQKNYLVGVLSQVILFFQLLGLVFFVFTLNIHLPNLVKGAMCANGVLTANEFGSPLLYLKISSIFVYTTFLCYQYLDNQTPYYLLTPKKYWWLLPSFAFLLADFILQILFYTHIIPNRIVTCCSLNFTSTQTTNNLLVNSLSFTNTSIFLWLFCGILLLFLLLLPFYKHKKLQSQTIQSQVIFGSKKYNWFVLGIAILYVFLAIWLLENFFVKYIYGIPTHACLHDLFLPHYKSIGFLFFGCYYIILVGASWLLINKNQLTKIPSLSKTNHTKVITPKITMIVSIALVLSIVIPLFYWLSWRGEM
jgi:hypothetical protein